MSNSIAFCKFVNRAVISSTFPSLFKTSTVNNNNTSSTELSSSQFFSPIVEEKSGSGVSVMKLLKQIVS